MGVPYEERFYVRELAEKLLNAAQQEGNGKLPEIDNR
jgi:hypothetical protein